MSFIRGYRSARSRRSDDSRWHRVARCKEIGEIEGEGWESVCSFEVFVKFNFIWLQSRARSVNFRLLAIVSISASRESVCGVKNVDLRTSSFDLWKYEIRKLLFDHSFVFSQSFDTFNQRHFQKSRSRGATREPDRIERESKTKQWKHYWPLPRVSRPPLRQTPASRRRPVYPTSTRHSRTRCWIIGRENHQTTLPRVKSRLPPGLRTNWRRSGSRRTNRMRTTSLLSKSPSSTKAATAPTKKPPK